MPQTDTSSQADETLTPYGTWGSPVSAAQVAAGALRIGAISVVDGVTYWVERRPRDGGRGVLVRQRSDGHIEDVTPPGSNVRTRVHEYGGDAYAVREHAVYYSEFTDQRIYRLMPGEPPRALTPAGGYFYADYAIDPGRPRLVAVREHHSAETHEPTSTIVTVPLDGPETAGHVIASGDDFYASPRFSPDGSRLAWLSWRHPQMPWDGTELWVSSLDAAGDPAAPVRVAGGDREAIFQPGWSSDGILYFVSDRSGWWNLYRWDGHAVHHVHDVAADCGRPLWQLGASTWAEVDRTHVVVAQAEAGRWRLVLIETSSGAAEDVPSLVEPGDSLAVLDGQIVTLGGFAREPDALVRIDVRTGTLARVRSVADAAMAVEDVSVAEPIRFPSEDGATAHAFYYAPVNHACRAPAGERPPLIVISHGGPTASASARFNWGVQYWTTRGFAVVDVNYRGSAGFGRAYRRALNGRWGLADVADCVAATAYLSGRGDVDPDRLIIRGGSAGGYTTLAALTFRSGIFKAGASHYGVGDLERLALDTHKFESRYLDTLVGPYPEAREVYLARSPANFVEALSCPVILFQGLEDRIVPPNQSRAMAAAIRAKGLPVALLEFEGEQHGFRKADTIIQCLEAELFFYGFVFGFTPAGPRPVFELANAAGWQPARGPGGAQYN